MQYSYIIILKNFFFNVLATVFAVCYIKTLALLGTFFYLACMIG